MTCTSIWLREGTSGGSCEQGNEVSGSIKFFELLGDSQLHKTATRDHAIMEGTFSVWSTKSVQSCGCEKGESGS